MAGLSPPLISHSDILRSLRLFLYCLALLPVGSDCFLDELTSARCQAKCLSDFEGESLDRGVTRKQLKHTIISQCRDDPGCASCGKACRVGFTDLVSCYETVCKDSLSMAHCYRSCHFMQDITLSKPGICPSAVKWSTNTENCEMSCINDGDCLENAKCCLSGCSKSCIPAVYPNEGLLPTPSEVTIVERKSGRSATIRWVMTRMRPEHDKTLANLYVIQWKWASNTKSLNATKWQTISVKNKLYAIIKHLLTPGLFYKFRVAAVNINGSNGFSQESSVFQLTKTSLQLGIPESLKAEVNQLQEDSVAYKISWLQCDSDSKLLHYRLVLYESQYDTELEHLTGEAKREMILSATEHHVVLKNLNFHSTYHLELSCKVEVEDAAVYSDEATLTFKTPPQPPLFSDSIK